MRSGSVKGLLALLVLAVGLAAVRQLQPRLGRQLDGAYLVSSGQRIEGDSIPFPGRPSDFALHPSGQFMAVLNQNEIFLCSPTGVLARTRVPLDNTNAGFRGVLWDYDQRGVHWTPDGMRFLVSTEAGYLQEVLYEDKNLFLKDKISLTNPGDSRNPYPGGMCLTRDHKNIFVAELGLDAVGEIDIASHKKVREFLTQRFPFEVKLTEDEKTLVVSNWGGRPPKLGEAADNSGGEDVLVDEKGAAISGTVSLIDRASGERTDIEVGIHPCGLAIRGSKAYVANAMSDSVSEIDILGKKVVRTIPIRWGNLRVLGSMPNSLEVRGDTLYAANGGDNALCEIDLKSGAVRGFRHAGFYPISLQLSPDGKTAYVLNSKGNGSVENTNHGNAGNPHDFQGTITVVDLTKDLKSDTALVARNNHWGMAPETVQSKLAVYQGAIKHVVYIIKENQTFDSIFGDMPGANGDPRLCYLGEPVFPNHRELAREFGLFDNFYCSGTDSADGHAWCTQAMCTDFLEHFYVSSSRCYPDDGDDAMAISSGGALWDAALKKKKTLRVYGEFCDDELSEFAPYKPKNWFEAYNDYKSGKHKFHYTVGTRIPSLRPYICTTVQYWPLLQCDNAKTDVILDEYREFSQKDKAPNLTIITLGCDHTEGTNPDYPSPRAMQADNDLALGRIVDAITHSPQWKDTCIFVTEDDGQASPDHVDGHRTVCLAISPYSRRRIFEHNFYTQTNMLRSMELMLGLDPMNRFDALSRPIESCFSDTPDYTPYTCRPNNIPLDEPNPSGAAMSQQERYWLAQTQSLDWTHRDAADPAVVRRINWFSATNGKPYPTWVK